MGPEGETAREAVSRIRAWLADNPDFREKKGLPRLAVRFCGGCNPQLDRGLVLKIIHENLLGQVGWVPWGEETDLLLLLNGCPVSCADRPDVREKSRTILTISGNVVSGIEERT